MSIKILLDTDIDILGDIDDALCLAYLLEQPRCDVLGITTVTYGTHERANVASALCHAAGKDIPIFPGASRPLLAPLPEIASAPTQMDEQAILQRWAHHREWAQGQAVEFMRQTIRAHPGEIVLLAIGPLTNVALLFGVDPEIPGLLKSLVMMGGAFAGQVANRREWNARFDPHAAAIVYRAAVPIHRSIGLDVTEQVTMDAPTFRQRFPQRRHPLHDFADTWFQQRSTITFHDPLAAATVFDERICRFERGTVDVELARADMQGLTRWTPNCDGHRHEVALDVDRERFFEHYFGVFR